MRSNINVLFNGSGNQEVADRLQTVADAKTGVNSFSDKEIDKGGCRVADGFAIVALKRLRFTSILRYTSMIFMFIC